MDGRETEEFGKRLDQDGRLRSGSLGAYSQATLALACSRLSVNGAYRMRPGDVRRAGSGRERG